MKLHRLIRIPIFSLFLILPLWYGCSVLNIPTYNQAEYAQFVEIAASAAESKCEPAENARLSALSARAVIYSTHLPHNDLIADSAELMHTTILTLKLAPVDSGYCHLKLRTITAMATTLADAAGGKTR